MCGRSRPALAFSFIEAPGQGWGSARTLGGLAADVVVLAGFVLWERRRRAPMLDPRVFAHRGLAVGSLSIFVQFFALFGFIFIVLQSAHVRPMLPSARLAPMLAARLGARTASAAGLALIAAALAVLAQLTGTSGYWLLAAGLILWAPASAWPRHRPPAASPRPCPPPARASDRRSTTCPENSAARWASR
ncbi:MAG TPA: hypothetical protein VGR98_13380 [Streptosporangiaceae bacterium]|nr:hypothetical protein [Streptosporangiaceae bacterium]